MVPVVVRIRFYRAPSEATAAGSVGPQEPVDVRSTRTNATVRIIRVRIADRIEQACRQVLTCIRGQQIRATVTGCFGSLTLRP